MRTKNVQIYNVKVIIAKRIKRLAKRIAKEIPSVWNNRIGVAVRIRMLKAGVVLWHGSSLGKKASREYSAAMKLFMANRHNVRGR